MNGPIEAPIKKDEILAKFENNLWWWVNWSIWTYYRLRMIKKVNIFSRLMKSLNYLIWGDV